jgi:hypothetical protein
MERKKKLDVQTTGCNLKLFFQQTLKMVKTPLVKRVLVKKP